MLAKYLSLLFNKLSRLSRWLPWWLCLQCGSSGFAPWLGKIPWRRKWQPTPVFLPGESHGQRSVAGYSPWDCKESDTTERLSLSECACVHVCAQSCLTLCDLTDYSPPGSSVHEISQARILERVNISSSRGSSLPKDPTLLHWQQD